MPRLPRGDPKAAKGAEIDQAELNPVFAAAEAPDTNLVVGTLKIKRSPRIEEQLDSELRRTYARHVKEKRQRLQATLRSILQRRGRAGVQMTGKVIQGSVVGCAEMVILRPAEDCTVNVSG
jgi:hypothetical protein